MTLLFENTLHRFHLLHSQEITMKDCQRPTQVRKGEKRDPSCMAGHNIQQDTKLRCKFAVLSCSLQHQLFRSPTFVITIVFTESQGKQWGAKKIL